MLTPTLLRAKFDAGLPFSDYLATATPEQLERWQARRSIIALTDAQQALLASFTRQMPILVLSGTWCGDCVTQVPMLDAIARANPKAISLRLLDRDAHADLAEQVTICDGLRVPTVIFMNECFDFVALLGDRTLSRYRHIAAKQLGDQCPPLGAPAPTDEAADTLQDWVDQAERVQLLLRLSTKLRQIHND